jgi:hypothetical protein
MKIYLFLFVVASLFSACKKEYSCKCSVKTDGNVSNEYMFNLGNVSKKDARNKCDSYNNSYTAAGQSVVTTCESEKN